MALSQNVEPLKGKSQALVSNHQPSEVAAYATREILAGPVRRICNTYNILKASQEPGEAIISILNRTAFAPRDREAGVREVAEILSRLFKANNNLSGDDVKRDGLHSLMLKASGLWRKANKPFGVTQVQPLACFEKGEVSVGLSGELVGPNNSFNCSPKERCAAAAYLSDHEASVSTLINALHPSNLESDAKAKRENVTRRAALKDLSKRGPKLFNKNKCRALGDAYFVIMCPAKAVLGTTNASDFEILCSALNKTLKMP